MKTLGRPQSQNVLDHRNYFGTQAFDPDYSQEDRFADFLQQSLAGVQTPAPQPLEPLTIQLLLQALGPQKFTK